MEQIWQGIDASQVWDSHVHLVGVGDSSKFGNGTRPWFNPNMDSGWHPILKLKKYYMNGSCAVDRRVDDSTVQRMLDMPAYKALVYGEISAVTLFNHARSIEPLLQRTDLHSRLLKGSDYPLPRIR